MQSAHGLDCTKRERPAGRYDSDREDYKIWKRYPIVAVIDSEQAKTILHCVGSDQEIGQDAARGGVALFSTASYIALESPSSRAPDLLVEIPVHANAGGLAKRIEKIFSPGWGSNTGAARTSLVPLAPSLLYQSVPY